MQIKEIKTFRNFSQTREVLLSLCCAKIVSFQAVHLKA